MLFVSLHGGNPESHPHRNNVHAYQGDGTLISTGVLEDTPGVLLDELRAFYFVGKYLYVVDANREQNSILCYKGSGTSFSFVSKFVSKETCSGVSHPFDLTFDGAGYCYVSSQNSNVVTRLKILDDGKLAMPAPLALSLPASGHFYPGTFVASSVGSLETTTTPIDPPAGLQYTGGNKAHSVRGVLWVNNALYVADEPAGRIKIYDRRGNFLGQSSEVDSPVHIVLWKGNLYVSGGDQVSTARLPNPPGNFILSVLKQIKVKSASGMEFSESGHFYVGSRCEKAILKYDSDFKQKKFEFKLPDAPEFLLHV